MSYAIMRCLKLKGDLNGIGKHIDRCEKGTTESPQNSTQENVNFNIHWDNKGQSYNQNEWTEYCKNNALPKRINNHIKQNYKADKKIRKDAVKGIEYIFTSDNTKMNEIFESGQYKEWIKDCRQFLADKYGEQNILDMHLHMDETTPHLEVVVVPITEDGRLSAKNFINGKKDLSEQQTDFSERMEKYGMIRGQKGSSAKHIHTKHLNKVKANYEHNRN